MIMQILAVLFYVWLLSAAGAELTVSFWTACLLALGYGFLKEQFKIYGIPKNRIKWIEGHNKNDLSKLVVNNIYQEPPTNEIDGLYYGKLTLGQISATYKHYLALTDIVINSRKYAVIMEDNVSFKDNIPDTMDKYLNKLPKKWNILFY